MQTPPPEQSNSPATNNTAPPANDLTCPLCGSAVLTARHCKRLCENCGYVESCEDLFGPPDPPTR